MLSRMAARWLVLLWYEIPLCALLWPQGGTSQVEHETNCSLMITTTQVKLKTLYPATAVIFLLYRAACKEVFSSHSEVFW